MGELRVLHVIPAISVRIGGPAVSVVEACLHLSQVGVEPTIFTTDMALPQSARPRRRLEPTELPSGAERIDLRVFPAQQPYRMAYSAALARALVADADEFDVIHIHMLFHLPARAASVRARRTSTPYIVSPVGSLDPKLRGRSRYVKAINDLIWQRSMMNHATLIHYKTSEEARLCEDLAFKPPTMVVPNGVDLAAFGRAGGGRDFRDKYLHAARGPVIMNVGRIAAKKRLDRLIRAFAALPPTSPPSILAIVGPDDERLGSGLMRLAADLGVRERVVLTGAVTGPDRYRAVAAANVWALPSDTENFGNAIVEAMAGGVPVVVTPGVNLATDIAAAGAGRISSTDPASIADEITTILRDRPLFERMSQAARSFAAAYDWGEVAPRLRTMYDRAMALHDAVPASAARRAGAVGQ